ncbi:MAG TPA: hypothetical protein VJR48_18050, partial [Ktedonobacterales bacterium]|nr:hypothetical protein [Ktedonobacterales bacterium]
MSPRDSSQRPGSARKSGVHRSSSRTKRADAEGAGVGAAPAQPHLPSDAVAAFLATQPFPLDPFQIEA